MKKEVKVVVTLTDGYEERFTKACIQVAKRRVEAMEYETDPGDGQMVEAG